MPFAERVAALHDHLVAMRRAFYMSPELSGEEQHTSQVIAARLERLGLEVTVGIGGYGVVGFLQGQYPGPVVAYRADMDAMPIQDSLTTPYRSLVLGVKHACGHDAHVTIALGVAEILSEMRQHLHGSILFIFQPAEESLDGARAMLDDGIFRQVTPEAIIALHTVSLPVGQIALNSGTCLAGMEEFRVRFYAPEGNLTVLQDQAAGALRALSTAQPPGDKPSYLSLVEQMLAGDTLREAVYISCWPTAGDGAGDEHLLGLVSLADFDLRENVRAQIAGVLDTVTACMGATYDLRYSFTNPPLVNDPGLVARIAPIVESVVGSPNVLRFQTPYPFSHEDLALYASRAPVAMLWLGTASEQKGIDSIHHTPEYDIDEDALDIGVAVMSEILARFLEE